MPVNAAEDLLSRPLTRRRTLQLAAGAVLAATLAGCGGSSGPEAQRTFWIEIADAARANDPSLTADSAAAELGAAPPAAGIEQPTSAVRRDLNGKIRTDFAAGRTVLVTGWLLSRTEVLLAVLVAEADS